MKKTTKVKTRLLRALANHLLRNVKDSKFDMHTWCGTSACAFGHAPEVPSIRRAGLRFGHTRNAWDDKRQIVIRLDQPSNPEIKGINQLAHEGNNYLPMSKAVFGLSTDQAMSLFSPRPKHFYREEVARNILKFCDRIDRKAA